MKKVKLIFDYDWVVFKAACAVENRFVRVLNKKDNTEHIFNNRTEVYGNWRKKSGGWLADNKLALEDIEIIDDREVEPLANALTIAKTIIKDVTKELDSNNYFGYVSGEGNFRKDICTLLPYKGNRENMISPLYRKDVAEYLHKHHGAIYTKDREPDDAVTTEMFSALKNKEPVIGIINEKDYLGCDGNWWNYDSRVLTKVRGFGELHRDGKDIKGCGRLWKYFQICFSDSSDNYFANCFSDLKNGQISAYNALKDCENDKEAFEAMILHFKKLYPEPKIITNWRGDTFQIDWLYVMQEMFNMAHLHRWDGDFVKVEDVIKKLGV